MTWLAIVLSQILSFTSKLLERAVHAQLLIYLNDNELLPSVQSAYRQFFSTEIAVLKVVTDVLTAMDRGQITLLGMFDLSAVFDTVDHAILLRRLEVSFGIQGVALDWFASYLSGRSQQVSVHGTLALSTFLEYGVLRVLCSDRFSFFCILQTLLAWCTPLVCLHMAYADDLQVYCHLSLGEEHVALQRFRSCSDSVSRWMSSNRLKLNPSKTELMWLHSSRRNPGFIQNDIELFGNFITPVRVVRNLGAILDENMTMLNHISSVCQKCYYQLRQIRRVRKSLSDASKLLLVLASVHSRLDYCNSVLHSLPWARLQLLQFVLNSAARLIRGLGRFDHITPVLIDLHWLPYPQHIPYKICLLMFKCLKGLAPAYLSDLCVGTAAVPGRSGLRSAVRGDLAVPGARDTGQSGVLGLLLWLVRNVGINCWLDSKICRLVPRLLLDT